jgi:threonine/homoserine/homoserine lactone efflux protein
LLSGMGAATADAFYGSIAAFGLTFISDFLLQQQLAIRLLGGAFLCYLGLRAILSRPAMIDRRATSGNLANAYGSTFLLTLTNPLTILSFAAIFAGFGLAAERHSYYSAGFMVLGVFLGSTAWWLILSEVTGLLKSRLNLTSLTWVNRISGIILLGFGITALLAFW